MDLFSADCLFAARTQADSLVVAEYFADIARSYAARGYRRLDIFLDNNPTHKKKMQGAFEQQTEELVIATRFHYIAPYSPKLNLVEYLIHLLRQKLLHHADCKQNLATFERVIKEYCDSGQAITKEQIINILTYIDTLVPEE